ncbi:SDR family oxidoreductase [Sinorhizobium chiapasense]|uniref:SDR family oxidoreductase n=1 Tax=Sinorhizobium chiapasense TaxID=501572 RepID=A0ABZ2BEB6_9HYPH
MPRLEGKIAIITGASSGIGRAAAALFSREGAKLVVTARRERELKELVQEIEDAGGEAAILAGDIRDEALNEALVDVAIRRFGGLDIAFNNAGALGAIGELPSLSIEDWRETLDTNLTSAFLAAKHQVPALVARGGGSLVFTSSFVGHTAGFPGTTAYAASKAGLVGLTQSLAVEFGRRGVRVNALLPGGTDTPSNHANLPGAAPETRGFIESLHALKRMGRPEEIAEAALYLASDAASFVTGAALLVDGGVSINRT